MIHPSTKCVEATLARNCIPANKKRDRKISTTAGKGEGERSMEAGREGGEGGRYSEAEREGERGRERQALRPLLDKTINMFHNKN